MKVKVIILILSLFNTLNAITCSIDERVMYSIAQVEKHNKRVVGYPYIISFNNKEDAFLASHIYPYLFLDNRTIDCQNTIQCADILYNLQTYGINNLDCGTYQINTKYWGMPFEDYFSLEKSYEKACHIIEHHTKGKLSWTNIAKYHSGTPKYNEKYKQRLFKYLRQNMKKNKSK